MGKKRLNVFDHSRQLSSSSLTEFQKNPPDGIFVLFSEADITKLDVLIIGPEGTPYQGGFFHFFVAFGTDYPFQPPRVKLMTTDNGKVTLFI